MPFAFDGGNAKLEQAKDTIQMSKEDPSGKLLDSVHLASNKLHEPQRGCVINQNG